MTTHFIGCTHFGHENIIGLSNRPFFNVWDMNETMARNWNETVHDHDIVYVLGDFAWTNQRYWSQKLKGRKVLVLGNHDRRDKYEGLGLFDQIVDYKMINIEGTDFVLFHYPIEDWDGRWRGSIHLHAHTHSAAFRNPVLPWIEESGLRMPGDPPGRALHLDTLQSRSAIASASALRQLTTALSLLRPYLRSQLRLTQHVTEHIDDLSQSIQ